MHWSIWLLAGVSTLTAAAVIGADKDKDDSDSKEPEEYIKVEVKGRLVHGIAAIGGETTGTIISAKGVTWELDLSGDPEFGKKAERFNGKRVIVTGSLEVRKGVEIPKRWIVTVRSLKPADDE